MKEDGARQRDSSLADGPVRGSDGSRAPTGSFEWPWYGQLLLFALVLLVATLVFTVPPVLVNLLGTSSDVGIAPYVSLTAVLISGVFLFTTCRIDRGARYEARDEARKVIGETVSREVEN